MRDHKWQHLVAQIPDDQPQAFASLLGQLVSYGVQRSSLLLHDPTLKPNTIPWTKHIKIDYHFVHEKVTNHTLVTRYVPASDQLADIFKKALPKMPFAKILLKLGVHDYSPLCLTGSNKDHI